ncbi:MAG: hypothetical protein WAV00_04890 [Nocardioides sp.]
MAAADIVARRGRSPWLTRLLLLAASLVVTFVVVRVIGKIDWASVWDSLTHLAWWQPLVLLLVVAVRQVMSALPLALYIRGLSVYRATLNDLGAILMAMIAPPPSDLALRVSMFTSWGISAAKGVAGALMNTLTFYVVRFAAPTLGFLLLIALGQPAGWRWLDLISIAIALVILTGILLVLRSEALARTVGTRGGRLVGRFRHGVDPEAWAQACLTFRSDISATFHRGFPRSLLAVSGLLAADLTVLVLSLRFVGVGATDVSVAEIAVAYLFAYPFTIFPFTGIGIVDAMILAALVESGGQQIESVAVAGLIVWRVFTVGVPVLMGVVAVGTWRRGLKGERTPPR